MKIIISDAQLRRLIPHVLATVEGEATLLEKLAPFLETSEEWARQNFVPDDLFEEIAELSASAETSADDSAMDALRLPLEKVIAYNAFYDAVPSLDLVLTPNGFGIVSNTNVVPASKERIDRLRASLEDERDRNLENMVLRLASRNDWQQSSQGKYFAATMFPFLGLCRRLAIREHIWDEYQHLHDRLIKIENVLADTYFSQEQMTVFRQRIINRMRECHPLEEHVINSLQSLELCVLASDMRTCSQMSEREQSRPAGQMMLVSDMQCHPQSFYDLVNIIREHEEIFPAWHSSATAQLYSPAVYRNKKESSGYWF